MKTPTLPIGAALLLLASCSGNSDVHRGASDDTLGDGSAPAGPVITSFFLTPSTAGLQPVIDAIDGANTSISMIMFHLTVQSVVDALVTASTKRHVKVQLILDRDNYESHTSAAIKTALANAKISVTESSTGFTITHVKSFVVDDTTAVIMSLNLTSPFATTRDYAVITTDAGVIQEFNSVFQTDLKNAANGGTVTPPLSSPYLVWSPGPPTSTGDSEDRLVSFINSAQKTLDATSESLGDVAIANALEAAAARNVTVRLIAPECDQNVNPDLNLPYLAQLSANGVQAHAMPAPSSATQPYMHAKLMIADGTSAYIGSVNDSTDSTQHARELGIFFNDASAIQAFSQTFEQDWALAIAPPDAAVAMCPSSS
jgi:phosphatidylserine/phosphatidylglycerophosphate/cardiolipin synthase-like enzyme